MAWDPAQYEKFKKERARPFFDLLAQLDDISPRTVVDLGCGTGELTAELAKKWPESTVVGVENSPEMLEKSKTYAHERLRFELNEMAQWSPKTPVDLIFSNAAFHWLKPHEEQIQRIARFVARGGTLAFQAPNQYREPSHTIIQDVRNAPEWRALIGSVTSDGYLAAPNWYLDTLRHMGFAPRLWETIYYQVLEGENAVLRNRDIMGATNPAQAADCTIRKTYAESIEANSVHGSDSDENAKIEIDFFFKPEEIVG